METKFKLGDIVRLKSVSPKLTVTKVFTSVIEVTWVTFHAHEVQRIEVPPEALYTEAEFQAAYPKHGRR